MSSTDDAYADPAGWPWYSDTSPVVYAGAPGAAGPIWGGWRWTGLGIPAGAKIINAYVEFNQNGWGHVVTTTLALEDVASPSTFSQTSTPHSRWGSRTSFEASWTWSKGEPGTWVRGPSLVNGVQELVDSYGVIDVVVVLEAGIGVTQEEYHEWASYDLNPTLAARLHIEYSVLLP